MTKRLSQKDFGNWVSNSRDIFEILVTTGEERKFPDMGPESAQIRRHAFGKLLEEYCQEIVSYDAHKADRSFGECRRFEKLNKSLLDGGRSFFDIFKRSFRTNEGRLEVARYVGKELLQSAYDLAQKEVARAHEKDFDGDFRNTAEYFEVGLKSMLDLLATPKPDAIAKGKPAVQKNNPPEIK